VKTVNYTYSGTPYRRGWISTTDLLALTRSDQLLFILKTYFASFTKQATLTRTSTVHSFPDQLEFPGIPVLQSNMPLPCFPPPNQFKKFKILNIWNIILFLLKDNLQASLAILDFLTVVNHPRLQ
jgi:hypothetical protein